MGKRESRHPNADGGLFERLGWRMKIEGRF
jgi:hypothetical protein